MTRFGLIGLGIHGSRYAHHLRTDVPSARLSAVCRLDRKRGEAFAREAGVPFFTDFRALLDSGEVDAVCAVLPPDHHPEIADAAADAGVALLLEKPMAVDPEGARRILAASARARSPMMIAHTLRYNHVVRHVREMVTELGPIHLAALNQRFEPSTRPWLDRREAGGVIRNTGIHEFDTLRFITGREVRQVRCRSRRVLTRETEDLFAAVLDLEPGDALATVDASRASEGRSGRIEIVTQEAQLVADHSLGTLSMIRGRTPEAVLLQEPVPTVRETLRDFVRLIRDEIPNPIPPLEGARAVAIADACIRSSESGAMETVEHLAP
jgi:predicted dehydrogenase